MKNKKYHIIGIIILLLISFIVGRCTKSKEVTTITKTITIPETRGSFETPKVIVPESNEIKTVIQYKDTTLVIHQVNEELVNKYLESQEELERLKLYTNAISINNYKNTFDNEDIQLTILSKTEGKLLEVKPEYIIKEKKLPVTIEVPKEELLFRLNAGIYSTYSTELKTYDPGVKLDFINNKNHIISAGYSINKNVMVSYTIPLFKVNK